MTRTATSEEIASQPDAWEGAVMDGKMPKQAIGKMAGRSVLNSPAAVGATRKCGASWGGWSMDMPPGEMPRTLDDGSAITPFERTTPAALAPDE